MSSDPSWKYSSLPTAPGSTSTAPPPTTTSTPSTSQRSLSPSSQRKLNLRKYNDGSIILRDHKTCPHPSHKRVNLVTDFHNNAQSTFIDRDQQHNARINWYKKLHPTYYKENYNDDAEGVLIRDVLRLERRAVRGGNGNFGRAVSNKAVTARGSSTVKQAGNGPPEQQQQQQQQQQSTTLTRQNSRGGKGLRGAMGPPPKPLLTKGKNSNKTTTAPANGVKKASGGKFAPGTAGPGIHMLRGDRAKYYADILKQGLENSKK